jgi:multidrug efflux pump subunit AcrB
MSKKFNGLRAFLPTSVAVSNGTSVFLLALMILIFGLQSYRSMPKQQYPDASLPTVFITTPYFGNSAEEIENLITRPLEKELAAEAAIKDITSTSIQDISFIITEFNSELDLDIAVRKVKDAIDRAKSELPDDLDQDPLVKEASFSDAPIMVINLSGDYSMDELRDFAEDLEEKIEDISEINKVDIKGALDREMKVNIDLYKMQSLQVSFMDIEEAIARENMSMSAGEIVQNDFRRAIRILGEFKNAEEIENLIIKSEIERPIYLRDIGSVEYGFEERLSYSRSDGSPVVSLDVVKRAGENLLSAADKIFTLIEEERAYLPENLNIRVFNDQSVYTRNEVSNLENSIISGVLLVIFVLLFFLGLRNALFVGLAIPLSMLMGILLLNISGVTINIVLLFSLILALGLLVDNAIVVVENIFRYMQEGNSPLKAAKYGAGEVALPIIASTLTTLAAFLPLAFWPGVMGKFMRYFPLTLIAVLSSSLFVALVINPVFTSRFMKVDERAPDAAGRRKKIRATLITTGIMFFIAVLAHFGNVLWVRNLMTIIASVILINFFILRKASLQFQNKTLPRLENVYKSFLDFALKKRNPLYFFFSTVLVLIGAIVLLAYKSPKVIFFPNADPVYINVFVDMPLGTDIEATNDLTIELEKVVHSTIAPYRHIVEEVLTQIGEETSDPNNFPEPGTTPHKARITVSFVEFRERDGISTRKVMEELRANLQNIAGADVIVAQDNNGPPAGPPINIELSGAEMDELAGISKDLIAFINSQGIQGVERLQSDVKLGKPEITIDIDRKAARRYGLSTAQIASTLRTAVYGKEVSQYKVGEDEYPIMLRLSEKYRNNIDELMDQKITFRDQARRGDIVQIPISSVADFTYQSSFSAIKRRDQKKVITVFSNVLDGYNANEIVEEVKELMKRYELPNHVSYQFTGEQEQQAEDMAFLNTAFLIAIFSIFIILVAQFNSIYSPFIIILSILFSTIGVFLGYVITGQDISVVFAGVGLISLAGVVVNNAIVLVDYINLLIRRKIENHDAFSIIELEKNEVREAIVDAGAKRLRPVLLTAITTVLGLIPLAIGFNFNFSTLITQLDPQVFIGGDNTAIWGPLAWTIIYGLTCATFLTLVIVPVMYWMAYHLKKWTEGKALVREKMLSDEEGKLEYT